MKLGFVLFLCHAAISWGMFHKRARPEEHEDTTKRFREDMADLFLSNDVSGQRCVRLFKNAALAGCKNVSDLAKGVEHAGNNSRDLTRRLLKKKLWPKLYYIQETMHK